ncbi:E3 ubiquitin protein ligase DRIP2 [Linum perenne]
MVQDKPIQPTTKSKHGAKKALALQEPVISDHEPVKNVDDRLCSPETLSKIAKSMRQDVWIQASDAKENENKVPKANVKEPSNEPKVCGHELDSSTSNSGSVMPNRPNGTILQEEGTYIPTEAAVDANTRQEQRLVPIWLSLIASKNRGNEAPLPQISSPYVMVKDGDISISAVRKYVVQKLGGSSEDEVELSTGGLPLLPALQLRNVVQWWLQSVPASGRVVASAGSSARDVVMPLYYSRKP